MKKLDILGDNGVCFFFLFFLSVYVHALLLFLKKEIEHFSFHWQNLRNEEQVTVIQAGTVLSLCEKVICPSFSKSFKIRCLIFCQ